MQFTHQSFNGLTQTRDVIYNSHQYLNKIREEKLKQHKRTTEQINQTERSNIQLFRKDQAQELPKIT